MRNPWQIKRQWQIPCDTQDCSCRADEYTVLYAAKPKEENTVPEYLNVYPDLGPNQDHEYATASNNDVFTMFTAKETGER